VRWLIDRKYRNRLARLRSALDTRRCSLRSATDRLVGTRAAVRRDVSSLLADGRRCVEEAAAFALDVFAVLAGDQQD
jgi:hypothetical protein